MLKPLLPESTVQIRYSFLAYKDIDDNHSQFSECVLYRGAHFTEQASEKLSFIQLNASRPSGGKDICEDHLEAIDRCVNWNVTSDWTSQIKFIVIFTDAPAHGLAPPCAMGVSSIDNYAVCHPNGLTPASVASNMISKGVNLMISSYNPFATARTEQITAEEYLSHPDNSKGSEVKCISMVPPLSATTRKQLLGDQPRHMIFILDESGSMRNTWSGVVAAFVQYMARRRENQNEADLVSVVQFNENARVTVLLNSIGTVPVNLGYGGGGTRFVPASTEGSTITLQTPMSHTPTLVFMSDGEAGDAQPAANIFSSLNERVRQKYGKDLELHVIAFGHGASKAQPSQISCSSPLGCVHLSSDTIQLTNIFVDMAGGKDAANALRGEIAKEMSGAVSDTISLEYLS